MWCGVAYQVVYTCIHLYTLVRWCCISDCVHLYVYTCIHLYAGVAYQVVYAGMPDPHHHCSGETSALPQVPPGKLLLLLQPSSIAADQKPTLIQRIICPGKRLLIFQSEKAEKGSDQKQFDFSRALLKEICLAIWHQAWDLSEKIHVWDLWPLTSSGFRQH